MTHSYTTSGDLTWAGHSNQSATFLRFVIPDIPVRENGGVSLHNFSGIHWYRHAGFASLLEHKQGE